MNNEKNKKKWVKQVSDILKIGGRSAKTIRSYTYSIKKFLNNYDEKTKISAFNEKEILDYIKKEFLNKNRSTLTYNFHISALRFFYSVCFGKEFNKRLLPNVKQKKKLPTIISKKTFIELLNNEKDIQHKCWLILGFCCGLRAEEVSTIRIENIDSKNHRLKVLGKGNKERITILPDIAIKFLRLYYKKSNLSDKNGYLFKGYSNSEHINGRTISNYFTILANDKNLPKNISFHTLRHSFATYFIMNGGDPFALKSMLGHTSLNTTTIYLHLAKDFNSLEGINYEK